MKKNLPLFLLSGILFLAPFSVGGVTLDNPLRWGTFEELVDAIINMIYSLALIVVPIMIVISGFMFVTSSGQPRSVQRAKDILIYAVVGFLVILLSKGMITVLRSLFGTTA